MTDTHLPPGIDVAALPEFIVRPVYIDEVETVAMLHVERVDGRTMLRAAHFVRPVDPTRLVQVDWPTHVNFAVRVEAGYTATDGTLGELMDPVRQAAAEQLARRYYVTDEMIAQAAAERRAGKTIGQVAKTLNVSERTAQRYLKRAQQADLL